MAGLKPEEVRRLAHDFLTLRAEEAEIAALHAEVENNPAAALELLEQMRAVQGSAAPAALSAEQSEDIRHRVEALIASLARKRGWFAFFRRRAPSRKASKPSPAPEARAAPRPIPPLVFSGAPRPAPQVDADMEDTAPIAEVPESAPERPAAAPVSSSPSPDAAAKPVARRVPRPLSSEAEPPRAAAAPLPLRARPVRRARYLIPGALLLALAAYVLFARRGSSDAGHSAPPAPAIVAPASAPPPPRSGPPARTDVQAGARDAPLPAELPQSTPLQFP